jgi:hypothetical protein
MPAGGSGVPVLGLMLGCRVVVDVLPPRLGLETGSPAEGVVTGRATGWPVCGNRGVAEGWTGVRTGGV